MCTNRALTDLYAFSARFIQLLNRKLAYVCIADYYKSEQNVLFCLTLIIIFMKKHFFNATFWALLSLALWTTGCSDDDGYSDVDGQIPTMTLVTDHIESGAAIVLPLKVRWLTRMELYPSICNVPIFI